MVYVFFNGTGQFPLDIVPDGMNMDTDYFEENIIDEMARLYDPQRRRPRERRVTLHF
jgi:hypothetical protein